jgi:hypothetical protein
MDNLRKLTIIMIRLHALGFFLAGLIHLSVVGGLIVFEIVRDASPALGMIYGYMIYVFTGFAYLFVAVILYATSRSLANYFIRSVENVPLPDPPAPPEFD